jgi:hypothetical protein
LSGFFIGSRSLALLDVCADRLFWNNVMRFYPAHEYGDNQDDDQGGLKANTPGQGIDGSFGFILVFDQEKQATE